MEQPGAGPRIVSVNVGMSRPVAWRGRVIETAIYKVPVGAPITVALDDAAVPSITGDEQADPRVHGGPDKAVYAYAVEDYAWWSATLGEPIDPATFGENLTTEAVAVTDAVIGERWQVGSATLQVTQPRYACFKLGIRMGDDDFPDRFDRACRAGAYLRIVAPGTIRRDDEVVVVHRPAHGLTIGDVARAETLRDPALLERMLDVRDLPERRRVVAAALLERQDPA